MRRTVYLFCVIVLFLTGCVAAPEKITVDGVDKAINQSEESVVELKDGKSVETVLSSLPDDINTTIKGVSWCLCSGVSSGVLQCPIVPQTRGFRDFDLSSRIPA